MKKSLRTDVNISLCVDYAVDIISDANASIWRDDAIRLPRMRVNAERLLKSIKAAEQRHK